MGGFNPPNPLAFTPLHSPMGCTPLETPMLSSGFTAFSSPIFWSPQFFDKSTPVLVGSTVISYKLSHGSRMPMSVMQCLLFRPLTFITPSHDQQLTPK